VSDAPSPGGLRFALLGVPVTVRLSVVVVLALLGAGLGDPVAIGMWVVLGLASIVVHELGHALVARAAGSDPVIELAGFGGVTRYQPTPRARTRGWSLAIGLAGPAVGLVVGGVALLVRPSVAAFGPYPEVAMTIVVFTSIGWSLFNLLPIPPLDGGQALTQVLPGDALQRQRRAALVGVVVSLLGILVAVYVNQVFAAVFLGLFGFQNWRSAQDIGRLGDLDEVLGSRDWRAARELFAAGAGSPEQLAAAQQSALADREHQLAAEIGEVGLALGVQDPGIALTSARAWALLGVPERARRAALAAVRLGADPGGLDLPGDVDPPAPPPAG